MTGNPTCSDALLGDPSLFFLILKSGLPLCKNPNSLGGKLTSTSYS